MPSFPKPRLVCSKCIEFDACRWNGLTISSEIVRLLKPYVEFLPICPEVEIGLGVPRDPARIISVDGQLRLFQPASGRDLTAEMEAMAEAFLTMHRDIDGFILKSRSPSCGFKDVRVHHPESGAVLSSKGVGIFAGVVKRRLPLVALEDEGRLMNYNLRHHFLTRVFVSAAFREVKEKATMQALVRFHTENKYLLMAYHQAELKKLGQIVANRERLPLAQVLTLYEEHLYRALARSPRRGTEINVLMHFLGYFEELSQAEKAFFLKNVELYRAGQIPLNVCTGILKAWIIRFNRSYLRDQTFLEPYPEGLIQPTDSGKGRNFD